MTTVSLGSLYFEHSCYDDSWSQKQLAALVLSCFGHSPFTAWVIATMIATIMMMMMIMMKTMMTMMMKKKDESIHSPSRSHRSALGVLAARPTLPCCGQSLSSSP